MRFYLSIQYSLSFEKDGNLGFVYNTWWCYCCKSIHSRLLRCGEEGSTNVRYQSGLDCCSTTSSKVQCFTRSRVFWIIQSVQWNQSVLLKSWVLASPLMKDKCYGLRFLYFCQLKLISCWSLTRDLFNSLSTCRNSADRSIRADVNFIRYEFQSQNISSILWVPGKVNLADPYTKPNSPLTRTLQLLLSSRKIPLGLPDSDVRTSSCSTG